MDVPWAPHSTWEVVSLLSPKKNLKKGKMAGNATKFQFLQRKKDETFRQKVIESEPSVTAQLAMEAKQQTFEISLTLFVSHEL